jgi:hypothetical protein
MLEIRCRVNCFIRNLKKGNEVTSTRLSGELLVDDFVTPFVLQGITKGHVGSIKEPTLLSLFVQCVVQLRATAYTKQGYRTIIITCQQWQMILYIKQEFLRDFFTAICMGSI